MILEFAFLFAIFCFCFWLQQKWSDKRRRLPPGPFRVPGIGNMIQVAMIDNKRFQVAVNHFAKKYGDVVYFQTGIEPQVAISGFETVKQVFASNEWLGRPNNVFLLDRSYGKRIGIIYGREDIWRESRRFTTRYLRDYGFGKRHSMESAAREELDYFTADLDERIKNNGGIVNSGHLLAAPVLNAVWTMITGSRIEYDDPRCTTMTHLSYEWYKLSQFGAGLLGGYPFLVTWMPSLVNFPAFQKNGEEFRNIFQNMINEYKAKGTYMDNPENFVETYLREIELHKDDPDNLIYNEENLVVCCYDFTMAGADTTSNSITFMLMYCILYPEVQQKLFDEIVNVIGSERWPTGDDKQHMPYMEATIAEVMRVTSIVPSAPRMLYKDTHINNYVVPKGTNVLVNLYGVHMDEGFWGDPEEFRPERFLTPDGKLIPSKLERVIPFSLGKRNCVAESVARLNVFMYSARLLQKYAFLVDKNAKPPVREQIPGIVNSPYPFNMLIKPRSEVNNNQKLNSKKTESH